MLSIFPTLLSRIVLVGGLMTLAACGQTPPSTSTVEPLLSASVTNQSTSVAPLLQTGRTYSFRVPGTTNRYLARDAFLIKPFGAYPVNATASNDLYSAQAAAAWDVIAGVADKSCISLGIVQFANTYLQGRGFTSPENNYAKPVDYGLVWSAPSQNATFDKEITFCVRPGLSGLNGSLSLESKAYPGYFLTHKSNNTIAFEAAATSSQKQDATWVAESSLFSR